MAVHMSVFVAMGRMQPDQHVYIGCIQYVCWRCFTFTK